MNPKIQTQVDQEIEALRRTALQSSDVALKRYILLGAEDSGVPDKAVSKPGDPAPVKIGDFTVTEIPSRK